MRLLILWFLLVVTYGITEQDKKEILRKLPNAQTQKYLKRIAKKYLDEKASESGVFKLSSGVLVEVLKKSVQTNRKGSALKALVKVTYTGFLTNGTIFESTGESILSKLDDWLDVHIDSLRLAPHELPYSVFDSEFLSYDWLIDWLGLGWCSCPHDRGR